MSKKAEQSIAGHCTRLEPVLAKGTHKVPKLGA
jgi:hypothetical protein